MQPHMRVRPGKGPGPLVQLRRVLPAPPPLQPTRMGAAGKGKASPFIFNPYTAKRELAASSGEAELLIPDWVGDQPQARPMCVHAACSGAGALVLTGPPQGRPCNLPPCPVSPPAAAAAALVWHGDHVVRACPGHPQVCNDDCRVEVVLTNPLSVPLRLDQLHLHVRYSAPEAGTAAAAAAAAIGGGTGATSSSGAAGGAEETGAGACVLRGCWC